jgi:salicylate hydroxylase
MAGKTILIGDAAHASTPRGSYYLTIFLNKKKPDVYPLDVGQGCNIAIEDAEGLGYLFRDISIPVSSSTNAPAPEITKQLSIFQSLRIKRAHLVQFASRQGGNLLKDEAKDKGEPDLSAFSKLIYSYTGFEAAYKAHLAEEGSS